MAAPMKEEIQIKSYPENVEKSPDGLEGGERVLEQPSTPGFWHFLKTFRKLIVYVIFIITLSMVTFGSASDSQYYLTMAVTKSLTEVSFGSKEVSFADAATIHDIWAYLIEISLPFLFPEYPTANGTLKTFKYILGVNLLLGCPRLRQLRVRNNSCEVHSHFRAYVNACYNAYDRSYEDKSSFGPGNGTAWVYHSESELGGYSHWGTLSTYSAAGSYQDMGLLRSDADQRLEYLKDNGWIGRGTRLVTLDFTIYNPSANLFSIVKIIFELPNTGGVWSSKCIRTVKLLRYVDTWDHVVLGFEILFCFFTFFYLGEAVSEMLEQKWSYLSSSGNWMEILISAISIICIGFSILRTIIIKKILQKALLNPKNYPDFDVLGFWHKQYDNITAILVFICWLKVFKFLSFNYTMIQLTTTLAKSAKEVAGFAVMYFVVFFAYAQLGYLMFGAEIKDFSSLRTAFFTVMRMTLGDFEFEPLEKANRIIGPIFYITYVFFVYFILLNMFLAILNDTYTEVKTEMHEKENQTDYVRWWRAIYTKIKDSVLRITKKKDDPADNKLSQDSPDAKDHDKAIVVLDETPLLSNENKDEDKPISMEAFVKLTYRVDDLTHEIEQTQLAIVSKMKTINDKMELIAGRMQII